MNKFLKRIPPLPFHQSREFKSFTRVQADEFDSIEDLIEQIEKEMYVTTADKALKIYEKELAIPVSESKPLEERRGKIKAKELYTGKVGAALLEDIIMRTLGYEAKVTFEDGSIVINLAGTSGIDLTDKQMQYEINIVKPAHLWVDFKKTTEEHTSINKADIRIPVTLPQTNIVSCITREGLGMDGAASINKADIRVDVSYPRTNIATTHVIESGHSDIEYMPNVADIRAAIGYPQTGITNCGGGNI